MSKKYVEGLLELEDVEIIFKNFSGEKRQFNEQGKRNFSVLIRNPEVAKTLADTGWNVRELKPVEDGEPPVWHLPVKVSYDRIPPRIVILKSAGRWNVSESTVSVLDHFRILSADVVVSPYNWEVRGSRGVTAYLQSMYVKIQETSFDVKYSDIDEINPGGM